MDIKKFRQRIIDLAIMGKLVPQDPSDEPAEALLEKIREEKQQLVKEGKLKKKDIHNDTTIFKEEDGLYYEKLSDGTINCINDELPFDIPDNWSWTYLKNISERIHYGYTASASNSGCSKLLRITDIQNNKVNWPTVPFCSPSKSELKQFKLNNRDILIARTGGTVGKSYLVCDLDECAVFASYLIRDIPSAYINEKYVKLFLESSCYWRQLTPTGTGQPNVNAQALGVLFIPVPPVEEQKRIVERVKSLIGLADSIENSKSDLLELIDKTKAKTIDMAIRGELVPQDPNDEPAEVLLEKIREEKKQLVKEGKLKKKDIQNDTIIFKDKDGLFYEKLSNGTINCIDDEIPFDIPCNWAWTRLSRISNKITDGTHHSPVNTAIGDYMYVTAKNIKENCINLENITYVSSLIHKEIYARCNPEKNDVLLIKDGATTGVVTVNNIDCEFSLLSSVALLKMSSFINPWYIVYVLRSKLLSSMIRLQMKGTGITRITLTQIASILVPVPSVEEQNRIVDNLEQLFRLFDEIKVLLQN